MINKGGETKCCIPYAHSMAHAENFERQYLCESVRHAAHISAEVGYTLTVFEAEYMIAKTQEINDEDPARVAGGNRINADEQKSGCAISCIFY